MARKYTREDRYKAAASLVATSNSIAASRQSAIPASTIRHWAHNDDDFQLMCQEIRTEFGEEIKLRRGAFHRNNKMILAGKIHRIADIGHTGGLHNQCPLQSGTNDNYTLARPCFFVKKLPWTRFTLRSVSLFSFC